jgi:hypothetical protein
LIFVDSVTRGYREPGTGGELYVWQDFDDQDICNRLHRRDGNREPFCEGRTVINYNFHGIEHWITNLVRQGLADSSHFREIRTATYPGVTGEVQIQLSGLTALEELALFMLDKGYFASMLNKLRVTTDSGRKIPKTLYLHFLNQAEFAAMVRRTHSEQEFL